MLESFRQNGGRRLPLELRALAMDYAQEPVSRPNGIEIFQWRLCTAGEGELILRERRYRLTPGTGFLLHAWEPHAYRGTGAGMRVDAVGFAGEAAAAVLKALRLTESSVFRFREPAAFHARIEALRRIQAEKEARPAERSSLALYELLLELNGSVREVRAGEAAQAQYRSGFVPEMISYMEEHCELPLTLDDMAERFDRSKEYICTVFKRETGITYVDFLTRLRIFRARTLLLDHPEMKIAQVAERCGFSGPSYFGAVFKKDVGVSPGMFRLLERQ